MLIGRAHGKGASIKCENLEDAKFWINLCKKIQSPVIVEKFITGVLILEFMVNNKLVAAKRTCSCGWNGKILFNVLLKQPTKI
jgi:hypothetical protein